MNAINTWLAGMQPTTAALIGIAMATAGWIYTARRNRSLNRKQHTFNALLQASFNEKYHENAGVIRSYILSGEFPPGLTNGGCENVHLALKFILNHYEFIAAGIRNGDISERLLRDSERGTIVRLFEVSQKYVSSVRDARNRRVTYEHLEWLYVRWHERPPTLPQRTIEWFIQRPLYHDRYKWAAISITTIVAFILIISYLHLPGEIFNPIPASNSKTQTSSHSKE